MNLSASLPWRQKKKINKRNVKKQKVTLRERFPFRLTLSGQSLGTTVLVLAVLLVSIAVWAKLMDPKTLPMKQVQLESPFIKVSKEHLYDVVKPNAHGGFFNVDVDAITEAVEALPWVEKASVRRVWPDTLHVTVKEQEALARWRDQALVNVRGELFFPVAETFPDVLIELLGPRTTVGKMAEQFRVFKQALSGSDLSMARITLTPRRAWEVELDSGAVVVLGRNEMGLRLQRFVRFYPQLAQAAEVEHVDMRYTNGFSVKWRAPAV
ncbi:cell division protein FtsQ/DivIB [Pseudomonadota bacterium]